jgi:hypothetical protein
MVWLISTASIRSCSRSRRWRKIKSKITAVLEIQEVLSR